MQRQAHAFGRPIPIHFAKPQTGELNDAQKKAIGDAITSALEAGASQRDVTEFVARYLEDAAPVVPEGASALARKLNVSRHELAALERSEAKHGRRLSAAAVERFVAIRSRVR